MDLSQLLIESLLNNSSISALSKNSGTRNDQTKEVVAGALPLLLKNMQANVSSKEGEGSLAKALEDHARSNTSDVGTFLRDADIEDGNKILAHILGSNKKKVETDLAKKAGVTIAQSSNILANIAPLLLSVLGMQVAKKAVTGGLSSMLTSALLGGGGKKGGGGLEELLMGNLASMLTGQEPAKGKKKAAAKKAEPENLFDDLVGSLLGSGKKK